MAAVGAITETTSASRSVKKKTLQWTSSAGGAVSGIPSVALSGEILRIAFIPGAGGVQPSDLYDITLLDDDGLDVLQGKGANLSNAAASQACPLIGDGTTTVRPVAVDGQLTLTVANAGNAKQGTVAVYYR